MFLNHFGSAQPVVLVLLLLRQETESAALGDSLVSRFMMHVTQYLLRVRTAGQR